MTSDRERNRLTARVQRYGRVGANVGTVAARIASARLLGLDPDRDSEAAALAKMEQAWSEVAKLPRAAQPAAVAA